MNLIEKLGNRQTGEKNKAYRTMIVACAVLAVLLIMLILSMLLSFPDTDESDLMGQTEADSAVSEISAGLLVRSEDVLSTALSYVETYYATTPSDKRSELAARRFTELFYEEMRTMAGVKANAAEETVGSTADKLHRVRIPKSETAEDSDAVEHDTFCELYSDYSSGFCRSIYPGVSVNRENLLQNRSLSFSAVRTTDG